MQVLDKTLDIFLLTVFYPPQMMDDNVYLFSIQRLWEKVSPASSNDSPILVVAGESIWAKRGWSSIHDIIDFITATNTKGMLFHVKLSKKFCTMSG